MYNNSSIVDIDLEKYSSIERERETIMADDKFQKWCSDMKIGSRVEVKNYRAIELQAQYEVNYPKWLARKY
jgi:hypothetical protein